MSQLLFYEYNYNYEYTYNKCCVNETVLNLKEYI